MCMLKRILSALCCLVLLSSCALAQSAESWDCGACGQTGNTGKFCTNCGQPKPQEDHWDCPACGQTGNAGNFCTNCGQPKPQEDHWDCPACGQTGNTGNFCTNCGRPKSGDDRWDCAACGQTGNTGNFCSNCGVTKPGSAGVKQTKKAETVTATPKPTDTPRPTDTPKPTATATPKTTLSPENKCSVQPTIYCSPRQKSLTSDIVSDLKSLSAKNIKKYQGSLDYGLYFKFTPKAKDDGYLILRFDVVITGPDGTVEYEDGFFDTMECKKNYYWYWKFFSLQDVFDSHIRQYGSVKTGTYRMDIYFNGLWAGKTTFRVEK